VSREESLPVSNVHFAFLLNRLTKVSEFVALGFSNKFGLLFLLHKLEML